MARTPRCLVGESTDDVVTLGRDDVHHLGRVLRLPRGAPVELVDGRGHIASGRWDGRGRVEVEHRSAVPMRPPSVWLAVAPPRPTRLDWLVEKAAELGVVRLMLVRCEHGVREVGASRLGRLRRKASEAMLQSRRLHLMSVEPARSWCEVLAEPGSGTRWLATPPPDPVARDETAGDGPVRPPRPAEGASDPILLLVGPEGGLSDDERTEAERAGAVPVTVGRGVLRVETAALAMAVLASVAVPPP